MQTTIAEGVLNKDIAFPFQRWNNHAKQLQPTSQAPIPLQRMAKYMDQLMEICQDSSNIIKLHALQTSSDPQKVPIVPWMLQVSMRQDDLQIVLLQLQGNTLWTLAGMAVKQHALTQSRQASELQELMGKGQGKSRTKGKGSRA